MKTKGDSFLVEFDSALNAVRCAIEIPRISSRLQLLLKRGGGIQQLAYDDATRPERALQVAQLKSFFSNNVIPKIEVTTKYVNIIARPSGMVALYEDDPAITTS